MSTVTVTLEYNIIDQITDEVKRAAGMVVNKVALDILSDANASMEGMKSGRAYTRAGKLHIASAPGEPPAIDTGNLRASGYAERIDDLQWEVGYTADYAEILEGNSGAFAEGGMMDLFDALGVFAPMGAGSVAPRPFLRPAVNGQAEAFETAMRKVLG